MKLINTAMKWLAFGIAGLVIIIIVRSIIDPDSKGSNRSSSVNPSSDTSSDAQSRLTPVHAHDGPVRPHSKTPIIMVYDGGNNYLIALDATKTVSGNTRWVSAMLIPKGLPAVSDEVSGYTKSANEAFANYAIYPTSYCADEAPMIMFPQQAHYGPQGNVSANASPYMARLYEYLCDDRFNPEAEIPDNVKNNIPIDLLSVP